MADNETIISGMSGRYANALFELAQEERVLDTVKADLDRFDQLVGESPDLARLIRSPVFGADEQAKALTAVLDAAGIGGLAKKFLLMVTANRRLFAIGEMIKAFRGLFTRYKGEVAAEVTLAERPSEQQLAMIRAALDGITGKAVAVNLKIDPTLIGGLIVKLGSRMVDTSLRTKLHSIKLAMKEAG